MRHRSADKHDITHYSVRQIYQRMWPLVRPHRWRLFFVSGLITLSGVLVATMPMFGKYVFDEAIPAGRLDLAVKAMALFLALQVARLFIGYAGQKIIVREQEQVVFGLRAMSFRHVQRLCLRFHGRHPTGFLHDRVFIQGICRIGMIITYVFDQLSVQVAGLVFALAMCLYLNVMMTLVVLLGAVAYVVVARRMGPRVRQRHIECSDAHNAVCSYIMDKLQGNKTIQAHALEERVDEEFDENVWGVQEKYIRARTEGIRLSLVTQIVSVVLTALTYVVGAYYAISLGDGKLGTLVAFLGYQGQLIGVIGALVAVYGEIAAARVGFDQFFTVMDTRTTVPDDGDSPLPPRLPGLVEFRNVTFAYDDKPVLHDVSFTIQPGESVALVGRSGAGKSTLANLLLRFYDPNAGQVLVDGVPIPRYPLRPYRSRLGVVLQDPFLFDDTIAGNVRCVNPEATDEEVWRALDLACAKDFVQAFPEGLARPVGERGGGLSGGQRQRIAIARALLMDPDLLILDEPTAALDNESEAVIQHALGALFARRTSFVIAHRLSTIRHVDRVLVFDGGRLVEDGRYEELLARRGLFHHLHHVATSTSTRQLKLDEAGFA